LIIHALIRFSFGIHDPDTIQSYGGTFDLYDTNIAAFNTQNDEADCRQQKQGSQPGSGTPEIHRFLMSGRVII
jgi:hypothetical protein